MADAPTPPGIPTQPKSPGLFSSKPTATTPVQMQELVAQLNDVSRRLIILEERYMNLRKKTQLTDQNMLENNKQANKQMASFRDELSSSRHEISEVNDRIKLIIRELSDCAKAQEVKVLSRYIDMWNPVNFVTRPELVKLVKDQVETTMMDLNMKIQQEQYIKKAVQDELARQNKTR